MADFILLSEINPLYGIMRTLTNSLWKTAISFEFNNIFIRHVDSPSFRPVITLFLYLTGWKDAPRKADCEFDIQGFVVQIII